MYRQAPSFAYHDLGIVEDGDTASQAIEKDKFVIWKGASYFASTDILQGATLEEDVNLTAIPDGVINGVVSALNNNIIYREATFTLEVGSNTNNFFYITDKVGAIPAGYKYLSIMPFVTGSDTANYAEFHYQGMSGSVDDSSLAIVFQNRASASRTWTIRLIVTYVRVSS